MELPRREQRAQSVPHNTARKATPQDMGRSYRTPTPARESVLVPCKSFAYACNDFNPAKMIIAKDGKSPQPKSAPARECTRTVPTYQCLEPPCTPGPRPSFLEQHGLLTPGTPNFDFTASSPPSNDSHKGIQNSYGLNVQARAEDLAEAVEGGITEVNVYMTDEQNMREKQDDVYDPPQKITAECDSDDGDDAADSRSYSLYDQMQAQIRDAELVVRLSGELDDTLAAGGLRRSTRIRAKEVPKGKLDFFAHIVDFLTQ